MLGYPDDFFDNGQRLEQNDHGYLDDLNDQVIAVIIDFISCESYKISRLHNLSAQDPEFFLRSPRSPAQGAGSCPLANKSTLK